MLWKPSGRLKKSVPEPLPARILFYTEGDRLACQGSPVIDPLKALEHKGVELTLCKTCFEDFRLVDWVKFGIVAGMADSFETMRWAEKVISL